MKLSNLIGKQIYSLYETISVGTTCQALFNNTYTKVIGFYFFDENEDEHFIKFGNIYGFGDFLTIKNFNQISPQFPVEELPSPLNKPILDEKGNSLGLLSDIELDEKGNIKSFTSSQGNQIPIENVASNKEFILFGEDLKIKNFRPRDKNKKIETLDDVKVSIMKIEPRQNNVQFMPPKITISSENLIGKIAKQDLFGKNNELLIKKNQSITPKALELIKLHNKLNQLYHICF